MKQKLKIVAVAVGVVLLAGCGNKVANKQANPKVGNESNVSPKTKTNDSGVINSIKEAMKLGKTMKCTYEIKNQNEETKAVTYIDGKKYSTEVTIAGKKQKMVYDEKAMYSWQEGKKQGIKMTNECTQKMEENVPKDNTKNENTSEFKTNNNFDQAMDVKCEKVSSADFSVPKDIKFIDQCEMMKNIPTNIPNMPTDIPNMPKNISQ